MTVFLRFEGLTPRQLRKVYDPKIVEKAVQQAINKSVMKARTAVSQATRKKYNVKAGDITKHVRLKKIWGKEDAAWLIYAGGMIPLDKFSALPRKVKSAAGRRVGATVRVRKDRGRKLVKRTSSNQGGFLIDLHGKKMFRRDTPERMTSGGKAAIERIWGPSIAHMVGQEEVMLSQQEVFAKQAGIEFDRSMNYQLSKVR